MIVLLAACGAPSTPAPAGHLTLAGSSTIQPLAEVCAQAYEALHPGVTIDVQGGGSGVGVSSARSGLADLGMVSRALTPDEADLTPTLIGLDGIALVVHTSNPLPGLAHDQVVAVYSGATTSWDALGGAARPITAVTKEEGRSTLELFEKHFGLKGKFRADLVVIGPNGQAITTVAGNPDALAYVSIGSAAVAEAQGTTVRRVPLDGVDATVAHVADGTYPLSRELNLVSKGAPTGLAADFLAFVRSPAGQALVEAEDFVPVRTQGAGNP